MRLPAFAPSLLFPARRAFVWRLPLVMGSLSAQLLSAQPDNWLVNGDFEDGLAGWNNLSGGLSEASFSADSTAPHEGASALQSVITTVGTNAWDAQSISPPWAATPGDFYTLRLWARADSAAAIRVVIQNDAVAGSYREHTLELTTQWKGYSWNFDAGTDELRLKIHYIESGTFWFDAIEVRDAHPEGNVAELVLDPTQRHQTMIGFGGALTWYADRILSSPHADAITELIFNDLGADIIRFGNWYYPQDYPASTDPTDIPSSERTLFDTTNALYERAVATNPAIKVLLSSWGPPPALKSNAHLREGTLKKENGAFVYDAYAQYWVDSLDQIGFVPDYLSIQNEPGYTNPGWTTSEWRPVETDAFPGYERALEKVHEHIRDRPNPPLLIGPEAENIGTASWDPALNTFRAFTDPVRENEFLHAYAYHLYNVGTRGQIESVVPTLQMIRNEFGDRPNFMSEFSKNEFGYIETAHLIQNTLIEANTAAYIYWNLAWDAAAPEALIGISASGEYSVQENYYALKHFAKHIDPGYRRIELSGSDASFKVSAFVRPDGRELVIIAVNTLEDDRLVNWNLGNLAVSNSVAFRTEAGASYSPLVEFSLAGETALPPRSITTYILELSTSLVLREHPVTIIGWQLPSLAGPAEITVEAGPSEALNLWFSRDLHGWEIVHDFTTTTDTDDGTQVLVDPTPAEIPLFYQVRPAAE